MGESEEMAEADVILKLVWFRGMADGPSVFGDSKEADAFPALGWCWGCGCWGPLQSHHSRMAMPNNPLGIVFSHSYLVRWGRRRPILAELSPFPRDRQ